MRGYWAIGRLSRAMPPTRVMTTDSTVAKIGRSMKNREITAGTPEKRDRGQKSGFRSFCPLSSVLCLLSLVGRGALAGRRAGQRRHGDALGPDPHARADLEQRADHHPVARLQPVADDAQAVRLQRPGRDPPL